MVFKLRRGFFLFFSLSDTPHYENVPFEVPSSWVWCKLEDYVKSVTDGDHQAPPKSDIGIPFLVISDVAKGKLNFLNTRFVPQEYYEKISFDRKPEKGDLLFTVTGSYGIVVPVNIDCKFCFQRHIGLIKTLNTNEYLLHLLKSSYIKGQCDEFATGTAQKTVGLETLRSFLLPIPPFAEQQRIVIEIEKWFSLIELIEGGKDDLQTTIKQAKSKILDLAIHGKLVPQDPNEEPAIKLLKRINPDFTPCDNGHYTNLPKGWAICKLSDLCRIENGFAFSSNDYKSQGIPLVRISNITHNTIDITDCVYVEGITDNKFKISKGDLLIAMSGATTGKMGVYLFDEIAYLNQRVGNIKILNKSSLFPDYRNIYMQSKVDEILKIAYGGAQPNISASVIGNFDFPLPPYKEQIRIVETVPRIFDQLDTITESL